jgi:hypothetical protein
MDRSEFDDHPLDSDLEDGDDWGEQPCPHCGASISELAQQCPACGDWITTGSAKGRGWLWTVVGVLLAGSLLLWTLT